MDMIHREKINMTVRCCDINGRLRPSNLLWMFQDASEVLTERHHVGPRTMKEQGLNWVVARLGCEVERMPLCEETVEMLVWAEKTKLGIYPWQYQVIDADGHPIVRGSALWVLSDAKVRSMLSGTVPKLELGTSCPPAEPYGRIRGVKMPELENRTLRRVGYTESDLNGHMNNAYYLDWVCDLPPMDFHKDHVMKKLVMDYRAESKPGEEVELLWTITDEVLFCRGQGKFEAALYF